MTTATDALRLATLNTIHALRWLRYAVLAMYYWVCGTVLYLAKHKGSKLECIQRDVKELQKLPLHIALVVNEAHMSHVDLARLVNWCFAVGTHYVSLYDPQGQCFLCVCVVYIASFPAPLPFVQIQRSNVYVRTRVRGEGLGTRLSYIYDL